MTTTCYRVQPLGKGLDHNTETSNGNLADGVHVFGSLSELCGGVAGWARVSFQPEIVEIECDVKALRDNGDYEGYLLRAGSGTIVRRRPFPSWDALREWVRDFPETL